MVESADTAYQLYTTGELDRVDLSESNLMTIYNNESDPYHNQLVEKRPNKKSYQFHFNYDKLNDDQTEDTNWNTAIANEAFRKCCTMVLIWAAGIREQTLSIHISATTTPIQCRV